MSDFTRRQLRSQNCFCTFFGKTMCPKASEKFHGALVRTVGEVHDIL